MSLLIVDGTADVNLGHAPTSANRPMRERGRSVDVLLVAGALTALTGTNAVATVPQIHPAAMRNPSTSGEVPVEPGPSASAPAEAIVELHRRSGLTWEQLARIFGVDRRSVHLWASGRVPSPRNVERLARVLAAVRKIDTGDPISTRHWLLAALPDGRLPLDLLIEGDLESFLGLVRPGTTGVSSRRPPRLSAKAAANREPLPPEVLVTSSNEGVIESAGRVVRSTPLRVRSNS